ncbi:MAG: urate oxidase [Edaphobacter sp.]|uniref:factor-independent urate hydroxylase n=1 Tax=Edaphobacter sp. TaxID=1934404 RepID=UPI00239A4903|nr:urate oxidase [Edaphobacter sp.]MDE1177952.1 urate oxidase [Edaphobacter sp.]
MIRLAENRYGKHRVRVVRVKRDRPVHSFEEWNVEVLLTGDFLDCFEEGDNARIMATDSMKNTVYSLAKDTGATTIEEFALELSGYLIATNPQIDSATVNVTGVPWSHLTVGGIAAPSAFAKDGGEVETTTVRRERAAVTVLSGLDNLVIMKTANSGFEGFLRDVHTTLPETADRLFGTALRAQWNYISDEVDFATARRTTRDVLLTVFAEHESRSVQHTLYAMAKAALESHAAIDEMTLTMPNKHCLLVDLSRFGKTNKNEIFVPTEEPYGYIEATIRRED